MIRDEILPMSESALKLDTPEEPQNDVIRLRTTRDLLREAVALDNKIHAFLEIARSSPPAVLIRPIERGQYETVIRYLTDWYMLRSLHRSLRESLKAAQKTECPVLLERVLSEDATKRCDYCTAVRKLLQGIFQKPKATK